MPFVKIDCGILNSTLWFERDCREVFITALLMAEPFELREPTEQIEVDSLKGTGWMVPAGWYGFVPAAGIGIIARAKVDEKLGRIALKTLGSPEKSSRSKDFDGRRLVRVDGGYLVLNYMKYRERDYTSAERSKRYRERLASRRSVTESHRDITQAEAEAEAEAETEVKGTKNARALSGNPHHKPTNLVNGAEMRRHGSHAFCDRLCVPYSLHDDFTRQGLKSDVEMKVWYQSVMARYSDQAIGDDAFAFWRNEFAGWIGTVTARPSQRALTPLQEMIKRNKAGAS